MVSAPEPTPASRTRAPGKMSPMASARPHPAGALRTGDFADVVAARVEPGSIDRVVLDMLAPWENVEAASSALAPGGLFLAYVATGSVNRSL